MIIGLAGNAGSGKDTVGSYLQEHYDYETFAFANALKNLCCFTFNLDCEVCQIQELKLQPINIVMNNGSFQRWADYLRSDKIKTQYLSETECFLLFNQIKSVFDKDPEIKCTNTPSFETIYTLTPRKMLQLIGTDVLRGCYKDSIWVEQCPVEGKVVVTDTRFPNEVEWIKQHGGVVIKLVNSSLSTNDLNIYGHSSESLIDSLEHDYVLENCGVDLKELFNKTDLMMRELFDARRE